MRPHRNRVSTFALLAALLFLAGCQAYTAPAENSERPVQVQRVAFESGDTHREFVGIVRARTETDVGFRVAGKITARLVDVGDRVGAGDVVARLDDQDLKLQVASAEAEFAAASSSLDQVAGDLERYTRLKDRGFASFAEFDRKTAARDEAEGRLKRARRNLDLAENQLGYATLRADSDGVVIAAPAEPGEVVALGQTVVKLARDGDKEAVIALPETWLGAVEEAKAEVHLWANGEHRFAARLRELSPEADAATRTYTARFTIDKADDTVALGMTATVTLSRAGERGVARLPLSAIFSHGNGSSVYRVDKAGVIEMAPVTVASFGEDDALVTGGVRAGDRVVTLGVHKLTAGARVRTVEAQ